jgi:hypothetical protein
MAKTTKGTIGSYNATIAAIKRSTGVSHREAQQVYRGAKVRMGRPPTAADVSKSRAIKEEARTAGAKIAAAKRAEEKRIERVIERARVPPRVRKMRDKMDVYIKPPQKGRRRAAEGDGGPRGEVMPPPAREKHVEYPDWVNMDPPDDFGGEESDNYTD